MEFNKNQKRMILLTIVAILAIILIFLLIVIALIKKENNKNTNINILTGYSSIKEVVEANGCKYINSTYIDKREFPTEIELSFKYDLYIDEKSNEEYYTKLINDVLSFLRFTSVKMIDKEKNIKIEVTCKNGQIEKTVINDIEDYFIYTDSQISISKYKEIKTSSLYPTSEVLNSLISNNWNSDINCGTRESIFKNYYIFFDEGIKYRKIGSKIYNIIFTSNYNGEVIEGISPTDSLTSVKAKLGEPPFEDEELGIIGYKGNDIYTFFNGKEISIYRRAEYDYSDFWNLVNKFVDETSNMSFKDFMNELTDIWNDYSEYVYDLNYMYISYPNRGIDIKLNYDNESGIIVYNNISETLNRVQRYMQNTEFISKLQIDNVFEAEKRRIKKINSLDDMCNEFYETLKEENNDLSQKTSFLFNYYMELDKNGNVITTYFISKDGQYANRELNEPVKTFIWISDSEFVFGEPSNGIYLYNVINGEKNTLIEGNKNFYLKKYEGNTIFFDNEEISLSF